MNDSVLVRPGEETRFDFVVQVDDWCDGIQPDSHDSGTRVADLGSPFAATASTSSRSTVGIKWPACLDT